MARRIPAGRALVLLLVALSLVGLIVEPATPSTVRSDGPEGVQEDPKDALPMPDRETTGGTGTGPADRSRTYGLASLQFLAWVPLVAIFVRRVRHLATLRL